MTTVAWRNGEVAADTQITASDMRVGTMRKIARRGRLLAGACGSQSWTQRFLRWFEEGCQGDTPQEYGNDRSVGVVIFGCMQWFFYPDGKRDSVIGGYGAIGSGREFATGALAAGCTPVKAVKAAAKHDIYTGGPVESLTVR